MSESQNEPERRRANDDIIENLRRETTFQFQAMSQRLGAQQATVAAALSAVKEAVVIEKACAPFTKK